MVRPTVGGGIGKKKVGKQTKQVVKKVRHKEKQKQFKMYLETKLLFLFVITFDMDI